MRTTTPLPANVPLGQDLGIRQDMSRMSLFAATRSRPQNAQRLKTANTSCYGDLTSGHGPQDRVASRPSGGILGMRQRQSLPTRRRSETTPSLRPIRWPPQILLQSTREGSATLRVRPLRLRLRGDCGFAPSVRGLSSGDGPCSETGARTCHSPSHSVTPGASPAP